MFLHKCMHYMKGTLWTSEESNTIHSLLAVCDWEKDWARTLPSFDRQRFWTPTKMLPHVYTLRVVWIEVMVLLVWINPSNVPACYQCVSILWLLVTKSSLTVPLFVNKVYPYRVGTWLPTCLLHIDWLSDKPTQGTTDNMHAHKIQKNTRLLNNIWCGYLYKVSRTLPLVLSVCLLKELSYISHLQHHI